MKNIKYLTRKIILIALAIFLLSFPSFVHGQILFPNDVSNSSLVILQDQFRQQHYALAAQKAREYLSSVENKIFPEKLTDIEFAKYYLALACIKTDCTGWDDSASNIIDNSTIPAFRQRVAFAVAQHYFQKNKLALAIKYYEQAGITFLSNEEIADEKFEMAYCYFNNKQFAKAEPLFASIREIKDGKYYKAGNYYYGLLAYNSSKFNDALQCFENIKNDKQYRLIVPYYMAETYYFLGNKAKALEESLLILDNKADKTIYDNELHLLVAQCKFEEEKYTEAKPYFEYFYNHSDKVMKSDLYKIAYCYYRLDEWINAIEKFKLLSNTHDSLGQTAMYLLGDCYLKTLDKQSAKNAYGLCADMNFNRGQQEASMMLYSMICYELGYDDESSRELKSLLSTFPNTQYRDEANTLFSDLLLKTHQYSEALKHLEKVKQKDAEYRKAYQKACYGYAVQLYRAGDFSEADKFFSNSLLHPVNNDYAAAANFWKGELAYKFHNYADVITFCQNFVERRGDHKTIDKISPLATPQHAYLTMGFASMELNDYSEAQRYFNEAQQVKNADAYSQQLATLHEADAVYLQKSYSKAISLYNKIIVTDSANADYAKYQKSIILGILGKTNEKISVLQSLINSSPSSVYVNTARYEIAVTYIDADKYNQALTYLQMLTEKKADNTYAPRAWMKIGFIYQQIKEKEKAIDAYKHVLLDFPASEERMAALDAIRSMYIQSNRLGDFAQLLRENNLPGADSSSLDSAYYAAAEVQFSTGNWNAAISSFNEYLKQFSKGIFALKAHYYLAECQYQIKHYDESLSNYKFILENSWNDFSENSAKRAAAELIEQKKYTEAYNYYLQLRENSLDNRTLENAFAGLMKSSFLSGKTALAGLYADSVLNVSGVSAETINDALLHKANSLRLNNKPDNALALYLQLTTNKNGETVAESRYYIAEIYLAKDSIKKAEDAANETIRKSAGYDYWIVKSYILLADLLLKQKDIFNARATLESVIKHTKIIELKAEASKKLEEVNKMEKQKSKLKDG